MNSATRLPLPFLVRFPIPIYSPADSSSLKSTANARKEHDHEQSDRVSRSNNRPANRGDGIGHRRLIRLVHRRGPSSLALLLALSFFLNGVLPFFHLRGNKGDIDRRVHD